MQILLRDNVTSLYYAAGNTYASDPADAVDFRDVGCATQFALQNQLLSAEVILNYLDPPCQIALPLRPEWVSTDDELRPQRLPD